MNYELTKETIEYYDGRTLYRIRALVDIPYHSVKAGDLGGFIQKVENLTGNAWVSGNAKVSGDAKVYGNAVVYGNARVSGNAVVYGNAVVFGNAKVSGDAWVYGDAKVYGNALVFGDEPEVKEDNPYIISDQLLADLKLAACQFEQAEREYKASCNAVLRGIDGSKPDFNDLMQARTALEEAAKAYAKQFV